MRILVIEDDNKIAGFVVNGLKQSGFAVDRASDGEEGLAMAATIEYDTVVLDIMLPKLDGLSLLRRLRQEKVRTPVLILSAKASVDDRVKGLQAGGDDYLTKPFNLEELLLRVDKLVTKSKKMREPQAMSDIYEFDGCKIDFPGHECIDKNKMTQELSKKEAALLKLLVEHEGEVVSREQILQIVWGYNVYPTTRTIDNFILNFRKFFETDSRNPKHFHSIRGIGYKFTK